MGNSEMNRRRFHQLSMAAFGGMLAGAEVSFAADDKKKPDSPPKDEKKTDKPAEKEAEKNPLMVEPHVCRGLNTCKGMGKGGKNECAGQGACTNVKYHTCHRNNDCKGQGGCGNNPGENACKGKGACHVPLKPNIWKRARRRYEELMTKEGKPCGSPPAK